MSNNSVGKRTSDTHFTVFKEQMTGRVLDRMAFSRTYRRRLSEEQAVPGHLAELCERFDSTDDDRNAILTTMQAMGTKAWENSAVQQRIVAALKECDSRPDAAETAARWVGMVGRALAMADGMKEALQIALGALRVETRLWAAVALASRAGSEWDPDVERWLQDRAEAEQDPHFINEIKQLLADMEEAYGWIQKCRKRYYKWNGTVINSEGVFEILRPRPVLSAMPASSQTRLHNDVSNRIVTENEVFDWMIWYDHDLQRNRLNLRIITSEVEDGEESNEKEPVLICSMPTRENSRPFVHAMLLSRVDAETSAEETPDESATPARIILRGETSLPDREIDPDMELRFIKPYNSDAETLRFAEDSLAHFGADVVSKEQAALTLWIDRAKRHLTY